MMSPWVKLTALGAVLCACSASVQPMTADGGEDVTVTVSPANPTVTAFGSQVFAATVSGSQNTAVRWSVSEPDGGGISSTGFYVAPSAAGTFHVVATSQANPSRSATATVAVVAAGPEYVIPADRVTEWKPGVTYNGGIPNRTTVCATLSPRGGTLDDTAAIQSAVDACPANQVVQLSAGTFRISGLGVEIARSDVTLRGAGPGVTILRQTFDAPLVVVGWRWYGWTQQTNFATNGVKGTNTVTLVSNPGLQVGEVVHVNETYDPALTWFDPVEQNGDYQGWGEGRKGARSASRPIGQAMEIAAISGNQITFTTKFHIDFRTSHVAHLARISNGGGSGVQPISRVGIEDLTVTGGGGGDGGGNIRLFATKYCWAKNIESSHAGGAAFAFDGAFRSELRDSYLHSAGTPSPGGGGYGLVVDTYSADNLIENSISWAFNKVMVMRSSGGGNVIAYNYMEDGYGIGYPTLPETGINASHMATPHYELFEGNQAFNADGDSTWGNSIYITFFRNNLTGIRRSIGYGTEDGVQARLTDEGNKRAIGLCINHWWYSYVGNVLGYPNGYMQNPPGGYGYPNPMSPLPQGTTWAYEWVGGPFGDQVTPTFTPMWQLGYDGHAWVNTADTVVIARALRDGNYDHFTKTQHWHGVGGTGVGQTTPPASSQIPASLYLTSKPAFFGSNPWPWVDPVTGQLGTLPARERFDLMGH